MSLNKISLLLLSLFSSFNFGGDGGFSDVDMETAIALSLCQPIPPHITVPVTIFPNLSSDDSFFAIDKKENGKRKLSCNTSDLSDDDGESDCSETSLAAVADDLSITEVTPQAFDDFFSSNPTDVKLLKKLLEKYKDVNQLDCMGMNLLAVCYLYNEDELPLDTVEELLRRGVNPHHEYKTGGKDKEGKDEITSFFKNIHYNEAVRNQKEVLGLIEKYFPKRRISHPTASHHPSLATITNPHHALAQPMIVTAPTVHLLRSTLEGNAFTFDSSVEQEPRSHFCVPLIPGPDNKRYVIESCDFRINLNNQNFTHGRKRELFTYEECAAAIKCCGESDKELVWLSNLLQLHANPKEVDPYYEKTLLFNLFTHSKENPLSLKKLKVLLEAGVSPIRKSIGNESFMDRLKNPLDQLSIPNAQEALQICNEYLRRHPFTF